MRIAYEENSVKFDDIKIGECFKTSMSYYMKTEKSYDKDGKTLNAVGLSTGGMYNFDLSHIVIPVKLKAVRAD